MKIKLLSLILALIMITSFGAVSAGAAGDFVINAEFEFTDDGTFLVVNGSTPAKYGQAINIVVYDPDFINGVEDVREDSGELSAEGDVRTWTGSAVNVKFTANGADKSHRAYVKAIKVYYE